MSNKYCPKYSISLHTQDNDSTNNALLYRARCKQWDCPYCSVINARVWRARIMLEVAKNENDSWHFWTVTLTGTDHGKGTAYSLQIWRDSWDKLMKRVKRDLPNMRYVRIFEIHKDGTLHIHMLADKTYSDVIRVVEKDKRENYTSKTLSKHLYELKLGWRHDIKPIITIKKSDDGIARNVSAYVTKYLTKDIQTDVRLNLKLAGMIKVRMIQTSQKWSNVPTSDIDRVWVVGEIQIDIYENNLKNGIATQDVNKNSWVSYDDFYDTSHYPNKISDIVDFYDNWMLDE